ncbi:MULTISPECIES: hypothetical protein [unclassified Leptolyngbya]|uniref:hypothetical protein n=1 Tax=unclassified Leptolyngbya TaxID=2650499 RepID=UPI0016854947|nr:MULTISPECIES: hypothetical protein [unclassified Leptolyngbya]
MTYLRAAGVGIGVAIVLGGFALSGAFRIVMLAVCFIVVLVAGRAHYWKVRS